jgi:hypothetical protein
VGPRLDSNTRDSIRILAALSSRFTTAGLAAPFAPVTAAGFLATTLLITSSTCVWFAARAAATALACLGFFFFSDHIFLLCPFIVEADTFASTPVR